MFGFLEASWDILAWTVFSWLLPQNQVLLYTLFVIQSKFSLLVNNTDFFTTTWSTVKEYSGKAKIAALTC